MVGFGNVEDVTEEMRFAEAVAIARGVRVRPEMRPVLRTGDGVANRRWGCCFLPWYACSVRRPR